MTPRERVLAAFRGEATDRIPVYHVGFCSEVASQLLGREAYVGGGIQQWREARALWEGEDVHQEYLERSFRDARDLALACEMDVIRPSYWRFPRTPTEKVDEHTYRYTDGPPEGWVVLHFDRASEQTHIAHCNPRGPTTLEDLEAQVMRREEQLAAPAGPPRVHEAALRMHRELGNRYLVEVGAAAVGIALLSDPAWFEAIALRPDLVARDLDCQVVAFEHDIAAAVAHGFPVVVAGTDFASTDGPMYSPRVFDEIVLPRIQRAARIAHEAGVYMVYASDGNLWPVADSLFGASGINGYMEIDRAAGMDLGELRLRYPRLTLFGNISSQTVALGTRDEVVAQTLSCLEQARAGGVVAGMSNYFVPGTPMANVEAVLDTIREHR